MRFVRINSQVNKVNFLRPNDGESYTLVKSNFDNLWQTDITVLLECPKAK